MRAKSQIHEEQQKSLPRSYQPISTVHIECRILGVQHNISTHLSSGITVGPTLRMAFRTIQRAAYKTGQLKTATTSSGLCPIHLEPVSTGASDSCSCSRANRNPLHIWWTEEMDEALNLQLLRSVLGLKPLALDFGLK